MDASALRPAQFRQLMGQSLQAFLEDWASKRLTDPRVFVEALSAQDWLEAFCEFAMADILNPPTIASGATKKMPFV